MASSSTSCSSPRVELSSCGAGPTEVLVASSGAQCRRNSGGTSSNVSLEGSTSSSGSIGLASGAKQKCEPSLSGDVNLCRVSDNSTGATPAANEGREEHEMQKVSSLLHRVISTLSQSLSDTQLSSFLGSDFKPLAAICSGAPPLDDDDMSIHSSDSRTFSHSDQKSPKGLTHNSSSAMDSPSSVKLSKRETLKAQKRNYRSEKRRATTELLTMLKDPSVVIIADWLKVRGSLKSWMKLWCVLKPGLLVLYKSHKSKSSHWIGTVLLNSCELLERPSKKDGFCFKIFHPLNQSIWATKGPKGENIGALTLPLPYSHLIFRAQSEAAGKCWMDALELALRCSGILMRSMTRSVQETSSQDRASTMLNSTLEHPNGSGGNASVSYASSLCQQLDDSDRERHFNGIDDDSKLYVMDKEEEEEETDTENEDNDVNASTVTDDGVAPVETQYVENVVEELGQPGESSQTEEVADEYKGLIWSLVKQVRPGMDLSKVVLPTFILEPRSFLDKLSDYYYHVDFLAQTILEDDPFTRMKQVVRWYLSGFYKKPKGLKKPYNPILGEVFRCCWQHPSSGSRTFYIAEQISHHPPVSAFYVTNRQDGYVISGSILAKSKFYGNSLSAILDGAARLVFLTRGEEYIITMPYAHCKGILIGTLTMELGGMVSINCEKTGYHAELEFKLKPFLGSEESSNRVVGRIKLGTETLVTLDGHWDGEVNMTTKSTGESQLFWNPSAEMKARRLRRSTVLMESQAEYESERLWSRVSDAIANNEIQTATNEKFLLEEEQRKVARERKVKMVDWIPRLFERNLITGDWVYKYADLRPWDPMNDVVQFEHDMIIQTKTRHQTPIVHTTSIMHIDDMASRGRHHRHHLRHSRHSSLTLRLGNVRSPMSHHAAVVVGRIHHDSGSSTPDGTEQRDQQCSSAEEEETRSPSVANGRDKSVAGCQVTLQRLLEPLIQQQLDNSRTLAKLSEKVSSIENEVHRVMRSQTAMSTGWRGISARDVVIVLVAVLVQIFILIYLRN